MLDRFASEQMIGLTSECVIGMPRNIHNASVRPYIGVNSVAVQYYGGDKPYSQIRTNDSNDMVFQAEIKNFGPVPGNDFDVNWKIYISEIETTGGIKIPSTPSTLFPGQLVRMRGRVGSDNYGPLIRGEKVLTIEITIQYSRPGGYDKHCNKEQYSPELSEFFELGDCAK
jgi:hypothetical protein